MSYRYCKNLYLPSNETLKLDQRPFLLILNPVSAAPLVSNRWCCTTVLQNENTKGFVCTACRVRCDRVRFVISLFIKTIVSPVNQRQWSFSSRAPVGRQASVFLSLLVSGLHGGVTSHQLLPSSFLGLLGQTHLKWERLHAAMEAWQAWVEQRGCAPTASINPERGDLPGPQTVGRGRKMGRWVHTE